MALTKVSPQISIDVPVGTILAYGGSTAPTGYLLCQGGEFNRADYPALYAVIADSFGEGNGTTTFNAPDFRGRFQRGWDNGAGNDPDAGSRTAIDGNTGAATGDSIGSYQADEFDSHTHSKQFSGDVAPGGTFTVMSNANSGSAGLVNTAATGGNETRPRNVYVNYIIKF
jgi:microcystin-dependent protein